MTLTGFHARGLAQSRHPRAAAARNSFLARIARLKAEGLEGHEPAGFLAAQQAFHRQAAPEQMAELDGIAAGFAIEFDDLWLHLHAGTLSDMGRGGALLEDGCSALAVAGGPDGPFLIKNRDLGGPIELVQIAARHPGAGAGDVAVLGSLLAPAAYSSGMNAAGLALADTHVPVTRHRVGWLRYLLMGHLLHHSRNLTEALEQIRSQPHCGGGTLELVDRSGAAASVELAASGPGIETGAPAHWRSNHYLRPETADQLLGFANPLTAPNSRHRLALLAAMGARAETPPGLGLEAAKSAFSCHAPAGQGDRRAGSAIAAAQPPGPAEEGLCQHALTRTLSCALWSPVQSSLDWTDGAPCSAPWERLSL